MKVTAFAFAILMSATAAQAQSNCVGTGSFRTCYDSSGNNYSVQEIGSTTYTQGNNSRTGSSWNQTSQTIGNTTFHNGTAANGNSWNGTTTNLGNMSITSGTDSRGQSFTKTCDKFGNCF